MSEERQEKHLEQASPGTYEFLDGLGDIKLNEGWHDKFAQVRKDEVCVCIDIVTSQVLEGRRFIMHGHIREDDQIVTGSCVTYPRHKERDITLIPLDTNEAIRVIKELLSEESTLVQTRKEPA